MSDFDEEEELWSRTTTGADTRGSLFPKHFKIDATKIETLADVVAIINAMDLHIPSNNPHFEAIKHLVKPVE